jgi:hypothetical protein
MTAILDDAHVNDLAELLSGSVLGPREMPGTTPREPFTTA